MFKAILAALTLAMKFKWALPLVSFLGPIGPFIAAIGGGLLAAAQAVLMGSLEILASWKRVVATLVVASVAIVGGIRLGVWATADVARDAIASREEWRTAFKHVVDDAAKADAKNKEKFDGAVAAAVAAKLAETKLAKAGGEPRPAETRPGTRAVKTVAVARRSGDPASGVRKGRGAPTPGGGQDVGQGMFSEWVFTVFGGPLQPDAQPKGMGKLP